MKHLITTSIKLGLIATIFFVFSCEKDSKTNFASNLDGYLSGIFVDDEPGGAILVMKNEEIIFSKAYGLADLNTKEKNTPNTLFNLGSISKTFVANGILMLNDEGIISIEDKLYKYFPNFKNTEIAKKVTIKHLLSHTSGLVDNRDVDNNQVFYLTAKDKENFEPIKNNDSLHFEPGAKFKYSNPAFNGLALIMEQVTHMKWQNYIREKIFIPSGMTKSTITDGAHPESGVAHAYVYEGGEYKEHDYGEYPTFTASGNGGVWSSVLELTKYEIALRKGAFLSKETIEKSRQVYWPENWADTLKPNVGYSWFIHPGSDFLKNNEKVEFNIVGHTGSQGGFKSFYYVIPENQIVYIALFNNYISRETFDNIRTEGFELMKKSNWFD